MDQQEILDIVQVKRMERIDSQIEKCFSFISKLFQRQDLFRFLTAIFYGSITSENNHYCNGHFVAEPATSSSAAI
ncbi:hypothetical protein DERP_004228 [Dermatophagoides pteronyssinus]|uniref:Uncharacterized protein n=1 Tax=Dermatophagoides pteronyssinus TaxID=6956 RepID=A0ABQ8J934_DERPT|nr:hypothetical protein DERP_004228 [Dermatophagoides pteronyssinus]